MRRLSITQKSYPSGGEMSMTGQLPVSAWKFHKEMVHPGARLSGRARRGPSPGRRAGAIPSPRGEGIGKNWARKKGVQSLHVE